MRGVVRLHKTTNMRKIVFAFIALVTFCSPTFAQKGMQGFGVNLAGNVCEGFAFGGSLKYQYNVSNYFRLEPSFSYYAADDDSFDMAAFVNMHIFFSSPKAFRPYFFAGPGYVSFFEDHGSYGFGYEDKDSEADFGVNGGLGLDFRVSHNFSLQLEAGAIIGVSDDESFGAKFNLGFCYNF